MPVVTAPTIPIGGMGGVGGPMPPMVPMVLARAGPLERIGGRAPLADRRLPSEHESRHSRARELLKLGGEVLAPAALRVGCLPYILMQEAHGDRLVAMPLPPDRKQVGDGLPTSVALLGLAHPFGRVVAAEREQRIADPPAPLFKTAERKTGH